MKLKRKPKQIVDYTPKPLEFPPDFCMVIDTREQLPLFSSIGNLNVVVQKVDVGDYTIRGFEDSFCIERKMSGDFYGYIGKERRKTEKKLESMLSYEFAGLVVEASWEDLMAPQVFSKVSPAVAEGFLSSCNVRYGIHTFIHDQRDWIERWILKRALKFYNLKRGN